jgi:hypothetical protein
MKKETFRLSFIALIMLILLGFMLSSCYRGGYGCHGNSRSMTGEGHYKKYSRLN